MADPSFAFTSAFNVGLRGSVHSDPAFRFRPSQSILRHEEVAHGDVPLEVAEEGGGRDLGPFVAFDRLFAVTFRFIRKV